MCNKHPILFMSNFTSMTFVASLRLEKTMTPFWFWISSTTPYFVSQFFPISSPFQLEFHPDFSTKSCLPFLWIQLISILVSYSTFKACGVSIFYPGADILDEASSSKTNSKWRQMTIVRRQMPVCIIINTLYTKLKCVFYRSNELILPFF